MLPFTREQKLVYLAKQEVARAAVRQAIEKGFLTRPPLCENCGQPPRERNSTKRRVVVDAAHYDYDHPLDVRWLCKPCHRKWDTAQAERGVFHGQSPLQRTLVEGYWGVMQGAELSYNRKALGITQRELAQSAGVSQPSISNLERGNSMAPETQTRVLTALNEYMANVPSFEPWSLNHGW